MAEQQSYIGQVEKVTETHTIAHLRPLYLYNKKDASLDWHLFSADEVRKRFPIEFA